MTVLAVVTTSTSMDRSKFSKQDVASEDDDSVTVVDERFLSGGGTPRTTILVVEPPQRDKGSTAPSQPSMGDVEFETFSSQQQQQQQEPASSSTVPSTPEFGEESHEPRELVISPATQTLNALSQDMGDLRAVVDGHLPPTTTITTTTSASPPPASRSLEHCWNTHYYQDKYDWIPIRMNVPSNHVLGMTLQKGQFDHGDNSNASKSQDRRRPCYILELKSGQAADKQGLKSGDWICHPKSDDAAHPYLATIEDVQGWAKSNQKSFDCSVLRLKKMMSSNPPTIPVVSADSKKQDHQRLTQHHDVTLSNQNDGIHGCEPFKKQPTIQIVGEPSGILERDLPIVNKSAVPEAESATASSHDEIPRFCRLCTNIHLKHQDRHSAACGGSSNIPRAHHAWCPQNPFFEHSGSKELLDRIQQGRCQLHCAACETEYQTGRLEPTKNHSQSCLENQTRVNKQDEKMLRRQDEEELQKMQAERKKKKRADRRRPQVQTKKQHDLMLSSGGNDENELRSDQPLAKKKKRTVTAASKKIGVTAVAVSSTSRARSNDSTEKVLRPGTTTRTTTPRALSLTTPLLTHGQDPTPRVTPSVTEARTLRDLQWPKKMRRFKPIWRYSVENPWGPSGFQDGDILLYGPQRDASRRETLLPCPRYSLCPFADGSSYRTTHHHPGIVLLSLRRDPSAQIPWGFEVSRDEFGQACLVKDVQPISPAAEALILGSPHTLGLRVHDMVLMVNGHPVGGMTEVGLEVELELSGPTLHLGVAQYRHARGTSSQRASLEMEVTSVVDEALWDDRVVGWREIGYGSDQPLPLVHPLQLVVEATSDRATDEPRESLRALRAPEVELSRVEERPDYIRSPYALKVPVKHHQDSLDSEVEDFDDEKKSRSVSLEKPEEPFLLAPASSKNSDCVQKIVLDSHIEDSGTSAHRRAYSSGSEDSQSSQSKGEDESQQWEDDNNPWNGCVCGEIHKESRMFWIQCDMCSSWYDVAERCVGVSEKRAQTLGKWVCWACSDGEGSTTLLGKSPFVSASNSCAQHQSSGGSSSREITLSTSQQELSHLDSDKKPCSPTTESQPQCTVMETDHMQKSVCVIPKPSSEANSSVPGNDNQSTMTETMRKGQSKTTCVRQRPLKRNPDGCLISNSKPRKLDDGTFKRPPGRGPDGFEWDRFQCVWNPIVLEEDQTPLQMRKDGDLVTDSKITRREDGTKERQSGKAPRIQTWDKHRCAWPPDHTLSQQQSGPTSKATTVKPGMGRTPSMNKKLSGRGSSKDSASMISSSSRRHKPRSEMEEVKGDGDVHILFQVGDMVDVIPHAWPTVNRVGGIGTVVRAYFDEDGARVYDVKYPISKHSEKRIHAEWVKACYLG